MKPSTYALIVKLTDRRLRFAKNYSGKNWRPAVAHAIRQDRRLYGPHGYGARTSNIARAVKLITTVNSLLG